MEEQKEILDSLKGLLMMTDAGDVFVFTGYDTEFVEERYSSGLFGLTIRKKVVERLVKVSYNVSGVGVRSLPIDKDNMISQAKTIKTLVEARDRYVNLTKSLYKFGYVIKKK